MILYYHLEKNLFNVYKWGNDSPKLVYNKLILAVMKLSLSISKVSSVKIPGHCSQISEGTCGIMWRQV